VARCGPDGAIVLVHWDESGRPYPQVKLDAEPLVWYRLDAAGAFERVPDTEVEWWWVP
jgi:hypothetical protein